MKCIIITGHGGSDTGAIEFTGKAEREINRFQGNILKNELNKYINVEIIYEDDNKPLQGEIDLVRKFSNIDFVISIHNNSASGQNGDGWEGLYYPGDQKGFGILKEIEKEVLKVGQNSRGLKGRDDLGIIKRVAPTSIICEGRFLNNPNDSVSDELMAMAYVKGIARYYNLQLKENKCPTCGK